MATSVFPSNSSASNMVYQGYKNFVGALKLSNMSDVTYNPGSPTNYTPGNFLVGKNITIGSNATLLFPGNVLNVIVCDTLTLNGTIDCSGANTGAANAYGGGAGGSGAGNIVIFARQIVGTGTIKSNGGNGGNGATPTSIQSGSNNTIAYFLKYYTTNNNGGNCGTVPPVSGGTSLPVNFPIVKQLLYFPHWVYALSTATPVADTSPSYGSIGSAWMYSPSGGSGGCTNSASYVSSGGGGASTLVSTGGGGGASTTTLSVGSGGGGGGGGGNILIFTESAVPALTIQAIGGNGGNSTASNHGGGGGGGGGIVGIYAPTSSATCSVNGGTPGTGGTGAGTGTAGLVYTAPLVY